MFFAFLINLNVFINFYDWVIGSNTRESANILTLTTFLRHWIVCSLRTVLVSKHWRRQIEQAYRFCLTMFRVKLWMRIYVFIIGRYLNSLCTMNEVIFILSVMYFKDQPFRVDEKAPCVVAKNQFMNHFESTINNNLLWFD